MNTRKLFSLLKERGINDAEFRFASNSSFSCGVLNGELNNYQTNTSNIIVLDAIINDKLAMVTTENTSNKNMTNLIDILFETSKYTTKTGALIYKEKAKYRHFNFYNKELNEVPTQKKIDLVFEIEKKLKSLDSKLENIEVQYSESEISHLYQSTSGIKLKSKSNEYTIVASLTMNDDTDTKCEYLTFTSNVFSDFNVDTFTQELYQKILSRLNPVQVETKKQKVVISPSEVDGLINLYVSELSAEKILKNSSWFKDKINTLVANKRVTILDTPLRKDKDFLAHDSQGVPTSNQTIIKKGMLLTYLHNLETAKAFNVAPTGHASLGKGKIDISPNSPHLKPGRLTKEELIAKVQNGIYIESLEGFHSGFNKESGNFSLKAEGFVIKNGKIDRPVDMITVTGNLFDLFKNIKAISQNIEYTKKNNFAPCIYVDKLMISC